MAPLFPCLMLRREGEKRNKKKQGKFINKSLLQKVIFFASLVSQSWQTPLSCNSIQYFALHSTPEISSESLGTPGYTALWSMSSAQLSHPDLGDL